MRKSILLLAASALLGAGCLTCEKFQTFYLEPDGAVVWSVLEQEIRSDARTPRERAREGQAMLEAVRGGDGEVAEALYGLGARRVESRVLRDEPPYTVLTDGRFASIADALSRFLDDLGLDSSVELTREGSQMVLAFRYRERSGADPADPDEPWRRRADALVGRSERYRFVLTRGAFVRASGFRLEASDTAAVLLDPEEASVEDGDGYARYELVWNAP